MLVLLTEKRRGPAVLLIRRDAHLREHPGETAFPGGAIDTSDVSPAAAALREAQEEVGLAPQDVDVLQVLPELYIPPSSFRVVPVLAWWRGDREPQGSPGEVDRVVWANFDELADPQRRLMLHRPAGIVLPAFHLHEQLIWGMTATVLDGLLRLTGRDSGWDRTVVELPDTVPD